MAKDNRNNNSKEKPDMRKRMISIIAIIIALMFLVWTVIGSLMTVYGRSYAAEISTSSVSADQEMRGVWVTTAYSLDYPAAKTTDPAALMSGIDSIVSNASAMGMNTIIFQVRPDADAFYNSSYFPWSRFLTGTQGLAPSGGFDPLQYMVQQAHSAGIRVQAWINPYMITRSGASEWDSLPDSNPAKSTLAAYVIRYNNNYYFDPGQPAVRQYIVDAAAEIVRNYDVDGLQLDDYFYPNAAFDDSVSYAQYGSAFATRADWRRDNVNQLISSLHTTLHSIKSSVSFGVSPSGIWANSSSVASGSATAGKQSYSESYADSLAWIRNGWVDYIAPQVYWYIGYSKADYNTVVSWWNNAVAGTGVKLYIGMNDSGSATCTDTSSPWYGTSELVRQLDLNRTMSNVSGEIHFRYKLIANDGALSSMYTSYYGSHGASGNGSDSSGSGTNGSGSGSSSAADQFNARLAILGSIIAAIASR